MQIRSKREFFRLWQAGVLGNRPHVWQYGLEALAAGVPRVGFREIGVAGGGHHDIVPRDEILRTETAWICAGRSYLIDETAPDEACTLQGEIMRGIGGWVGYLGVRTGQRMRAAMAAGLLRPCRGVQVVTLLRAHLDASSLDDVEALFDLYPDATIELTAYRYDVGILPNRNTIIWEVRNY